MKWSAYLFGLGLATMGWALIPQKDFLPMLAVIVGNGIIGAVLIEARQRP